MVLDVTVRSILDRIPSRLQSFKARADRGCYSDWLIKTADIPGDDATKLKIINIITRMNDQGYNFMHCSWRENWYDATSHDVICVSWGLEKAFELQRPISKKEIIVVEIEPLPRVRQWSSEEIEQRKILDLVISMV